MNQQPATPEQTIDAAAVAPLTYEAPAIESSVSVEGLLGPKIS